ncbi:transglutaminase domain-containing protein [Planctomonas sp. JC2975]|uniref:transglutaminase-like domain-containing protein n=1 Tax=Planctomonas sp. JC2975 TaxID=2729626 RepID=UPI0014760488|nr:transglutaminase-like domain-containing protein [Planctomonas sp. JC2975]NNC12756.1 transglutaminase domain-containing protein [Planctomonas sp. JC2975]
MNENSSLSVAAGTVIRPAVDYARHTVFSDPGDQRDWLADAPRTVAGIRRLAGTLIFHYRASGDPTALGFGPERLDEIDLRYADAILGRARRLQPGSITAPRGDLQSVLGCCRDFTLVFVAMARELGVPTRMRIGFGGYLIAGWWLDHVIAEVWDAAAERWTLVEPQMPDGFPDQQIGAPLDLLDVPRDRFLVGADAWRAARTGVIDAERFVVDPSNLIVFLRSWPYLAHNLVMDLAAVNGREPLLWDAWGELERFTDSSVETAELSAADFAALDDIAAALAEAMEPHVDPQASAVRAADVSNASGLGMPDTVLTLSPYGRPPRRTALRTASTPG